MKKQWILSDLDLHRIGLALHRDIIQTEKEGIPNVSVQEFQKHVQELRDLADRLNEIRNALRKDWDEGEWVKRDQAVVRITQKPGDEPYTIAPWGLDRWIVVAKDDPECRPVNQHYYTVKTHAHRAKRRLNKAVRHMQAIMEGNSGALIV